jgi:HAMP domain-containing protein
VTVYAVAPALPLHTAGPYVAAAYIVFLAIILIYVAIMARRLVRNQRELAELRRQLQEREHLARSPSPSSRQSDAGPEREVTHQL